MTTITLCHDKHSHPTSTSPQLCVYDDKCFLQWGTMKASNEGLSIIHEMWIVKYFEVFKSIVWEVFRKAVEFNMHISIIWDTGEWFMLKVCHGKE